MAIEVINNPHAFLSLRNDWDCLAHNFQTPLLSFDWYYNCYIAFHGSDKLHIILLKENDQISAIAPLVIVKHRFFEWLELLGSSALHEPGGLLYKNHESLDKLINAVVNFGYPVNLQRMAVYSNDSKALRRFLHIKYLLLKRSNISSAYVDTCDDYDSFYKLLSKKFVSNMRNKVNRAKKIGPVEYLAVSPNCENLVNYLNEFIEIEATGWKGENRSALKHNKEIALFFFNYAKLLIQDNLLKIFLLRMNDTTIAMRLCQIHSNRLWCYKIGYDNNHANLSPGILLVMYTIKYCFENKYNAHEFLGSLEEWQNNWPLKVHKYYSYIIFPINFKGIFSISIFIVNGLKRKLYNMLVNMK